MTEITPVLNENLDSGQHLVTRRRLIKQAGAAGIALTALYVAPSFSSFGPKRAYAGITATTICHLCDIGDPAKLTMEYTGLAQVGGSSQDPGKLQVISDPGGASPVYIEATDKDPGKHGVEANEKFWFAGQVVLGGTFVIDSANGAVTKLKAKTFVYIYDNSTDLNLLQFIEFHTSCSQPLFIGDGFGTLLLTGFMAENGATNCDDIPDTSDDFCNGNVKLEDLTLKYTGDDDSVESHNQPADKVTITDVGIGPNDATPVWIVASDKENPGGGDFIWFNNSVNLNSNFVLNLGGVENSELKADTWIKIYASEGGALLQTVRFHTSCSKPLSIGDQFGAIMVMGFSLKP